MTFRIIPILTFLLLTQVSIGQELIKDINTRLTGSNPKHLTATEDYLYFIADSEEYGRTLFRMDKETESVEKVDLPKEEIIHGLSFLKVLKNNLYIFTNDRVTNQVKIWLIEKDKLIRSIGFDQDGTTSPTVDVD